MLTLNHSTHQIIKAVIFDMDGLLLDTEPMARQTWRQASNDFGFTISDGVFDQITGKNKKSSKKILMDIYGDGYPIEAIQDRQRELMQEILQKQGISLKPGAITAIRFFQDHDVKVGLATSTRRSVMEKNMQMAGLYSEFEASTCGDEVTNGKPDPEIFLSVAEKLGVKPGESVVFEDSNPGIQGAIAANMMAIMVPDLVQPDPTLVAKAFGVYPSLAEAIEHLKALQ